MVGQQVTHRSGLLKQQNKSHKNGRHRSKSEIDKTNKGRIQVKALTKRKNQESSREERRRKANQLRSKKREDIISKKRQLGGHENAPFLTAVIPLGETACIPTLIESLKTCDSEAKINLSPRGVLHINLPRFRQHYSLIVPKPGDLYAALDACKIADNVVFLISPASDDTCSVSDLSAHPSYCGFDEFGEEVLSAVMAQGLPSPVFVLNNIDAVPTKKRSDYRKFIQKKIERMLPIEKVHTIEKDSDALRLLHQIGSQKQRTVFHRDQRAHVLAEKTEFKQNPEDPTLGTLAVDGYIRYQPLNVNGLVHIPGWGDFQMERIEVEHVEKGFVLLEEANPSMQLSLQSVNTPDPMQGEQTWPYQEEMEGGEEQMEEDAPDESKNVNKKKKVPKGTSEYQAAWIKDDDGSLGDNNEEEDSEDDDDEYEDMPTDESDSDEESYKQQEEETEEMESVDMDPEDKDVQQYDKKVCFADEEDDFKKAKEAREDELFPDEVDTPRGVLAKVRFQKYRGLQSFRTSPWDPKENLPWDYSRTFQFENFQRTRKRIINEERTGAKPGWHVRIFIKNVPSHLVAGLPDDYPLCVIGILPHEQRMSVMNYVLKRSASGRDQQPIPSKERLIFHCGYRRFAVNPIFSQHTAANKHKYERFFRPESVVVATAYAPIMFPPASVLVFREKKDGTQIMVATGSVMAANPDRVVVKRVVLSGAPFKVHRKTAVIRFMFFNREDIEWFKPVELRTKYGRRGHIREPLGTHGHMKCGFDGQLKSQDTVMMNLYKRVFPKWTYDPNVLAPSYVYKREPEMVDISKQLL